MYHEPVELSAAAAPLAMVCFDQSHQVGTVTATVNSGPRLHASVKFVNLPASTLFAIHSSRVFRSMLYMCSRIRHDFARIATISTGIVVVEQRRGGSAIMRRHVPPDGVVRAPRRSGDRGDKADLLLSPWTNSCCTHWHREARIVPCPARTDFQKEREKKKKTVMGRFGCVA